ncbi:MAG TPA: M48 family metallopeptidase [Sphingomonas sp.]|nr:M48 family metallopeptidase [Sphingomonas sp.]
MASTRAFAPFAALLLLAAAQPQAAPPPVDPDLAASLEALAAKDLRVASIAYRLQTAAGAHCPHHSRLSGMIVQDASQYRGDLRPAVAALFDLGAFPAVTGVVPGGPADRAGVRPGDQVAAVNGRSLVAGLPAVGSKKANGRRFTAIVDRLDRAFNAGPVTLSLLRDGQPLTIRVQGREGCASDVQLDLSKDRNAGADGKTVTISQGIVDFAHSDDELAFVIAHELAHDILGHRQFLDATHTSRNGLFSGFGGNGKRIRETERQADYYGLYMVAWAGYDVDAAADFWRRMGRADPLGSIFSDGTHPGNGSRVKAMEAEAARIKADRAAGHPLVPDPAELADSTD